MKDYIIEKDIFIVSDKDVLHGTGCLFYWKKLNQELNE